MRDASVRRIVPHYQMRIPDKSSNLFFGAVCWAFQQLNVQEPTVGSWRWSVRQARTDDAAAMARLLQRSVAGLGPRHYDKGQVRAWETLLPNAQDCCQRIEQEDRVGWVAVLANSTLDGETDSNNTQNTVVGLMDFVTPNGYLDCAYVDPDYSRCGIASSLYHRLETYARTISCPLISTHASEGAKLFFLRHGFRVLCRQDIFIGSVRLWNYEMEKNLLL